MAWKLNNTALNWALAQVRAGKINDGAWSKSKATAAVPDNDVKGYMSKRWLAINPDGDPTNRGTYAYPFAIGDEVYASAVRAIIAAASGAHRATPQSDIVKAGQRILTEISSRKGRSAREIKNGVFALSEIILSGGNSEIPDWIYIMPFGKYKHPAGEFEITQEIASKIIKNFENDARDIPVDYEHQTINTENNGQPAPAMGWIKEMELRDDGIWGRVEWTGDGKEFIAKREYRYTSPVYVPHYRDAKTGEDIGAKITSVALTNTPFFPDQVPIVNKETQNQEVIMEKLIALAEKLGIELTDEMRNDAEMLSKAIEKAIDKLTAKEPQSENAKMSAKETSDKPDETDEGSEKDITTKDVATMVAELNKKLIGAEQKIALRDATEKVDTLIEQGRLFPVQKDWAVSYAMKDPEGFDKFAENLPKIEMPSGITMKDIDKMVMKPIEEDNRVLKELAEDFGLTEDDLKAVKPENENLNI